MLVQRIPELLEKWKASKRRREVNSVLFNMFGGNVTDVCIKWIDENIQVPRAQQQMKANISPLNMIGKLVDKLSAAYDYGVDREVPAAIKALVEYYEQKGITDQFSRAWELCNLHKDCLIQLFVAEGAVQLRPWPASDFVVWSDDPYFPSRPTGVMVHMGVRNNGVSTVSTFLAYTAEEVVAFDSDGRPLPDMLGDNPEGINPYGFLPFVYTNSDPYRLMPHPDEDLKRIATLLPIQISNLNYAAAFQSHSITVVKNGPEDLKVDRNPDAIWYINDDGQGSAGVEILSPKVDIQGVFDLIMGQLSMFLSMRGIRPGAIGALSAENFASGISKAIDDADVTQLVARQQQDAARIEREVWLKLAAMHDAGLVEMENRAQFRGAIQELQVMFGKPEVIPDQSVLTEVMIKQIDAGLVSKKFSLRRLYPNMAESHIDKMLEEIAAQKEQPDVRSPEGSTDSSAE